MLFKDIVDNLLIEYEFLTLIIKKKKKYEFSHVTKMIKKN